MSARVFIVRSEGGEDGPYSEEELLDALDEGDLSWDDWCRLEGHGQPRRLAEVFERVAVRKERMKSADLEEPIDEGRNDEGRNDEGPDGEGWMEDAIDGAADEAERVVYAGSPSLLGYAWSLFSAAAVLAAGYWLGRFGVTWVVGSLAVSLAMVVRVLLHRGAREYYVTTERLVAVHGWFRPSTREIALAELDAIQLRRVHRLRWLGVGTLIFSREGGGEDIVFERIRRVRRVIDLVRRHQAR